MAKTKDKYAHFREGYKHVKYNMYTLRQTRMVTHPDQRKEWMIYEEQYFSSVTGPYRNSWRYRKIPKD